MTMTKEKEGAAMDNVNAVRTTAGSGRVRLRGASVVALSLLVLSLTVLPRQAHAFSSSPAARPLSLPSLISARRTNLKWERPPAFSSDIFVSFSASKDGGEGETLDVVDVEDEKEDGFELPFDSSVIPTIGALALAAVVGYAALQLLGSLGSAFLKQLATDLVNVAGNLLNLAGAALGAIFGALKFLAPYAGEAAQKAAGAAAPVVTEATQRAAEAAAPVVAEATQRAAEAAAPVLDPVRQAVDANIVDPIQGTAENLGRAVDEGVVAPVRQAVDASIVDPIQGAAESVGRAVDGAIVNPVKEAMPELPKLPDLPQMPQPSVKISDFKLF